MNLRRMLLLWSAVLFVVVALLYLPTLRGGFVYDSIAQVLYSDYIHTPSNWADVLTLRVVGQDELDRNRPLHLASLMVDAAIWGTNPFGYRLTSVLLHALNAALLFLLIAISFLRNDSSGRDERLARPSIVERACGPRAPTTIFAAAFGALLFALHPLVVEAIAEPSNREDLLVLLPMLIGLLGIVLCVRLSWGANTLLIICSLFAVLAKESGIAVPFVFAVACWLFRRGDLQRFLPGLIGGFAAAAGFLFASYVWRPGGSTIFVNLPQPLADDFWTILGVQLRIWPLQFGQILWPWNLSAHYPPQAIAEISLPVAFTAVAVAVLLAVLVWRVDRLAALGVAVYVLCLLPASNFAAQYHPIADRYLYVPLAGFGMVAAALVHRLRIPNARGLAGGALIAGVLFLLSLEYAANLRRQLIWQQPATLWSDVLRQYPNVPQAQIGLANAHYRAGDFQAARSAATEAVVSGGGRWAEAWSLRALCEWQTGDRAAAGRSFREAKSLSRVYGNADSMERALLWSPEQLSVLAEIAREQ